jgi:hypothetical protein
VPEHSAHLVSRGGCRWPHGDVRSGNFHYCEATPVIEVTPYCAAHCKIAYNKANKASGERLMRYALRTA